MIITQLPLHLLDSDNVNDFVQITDIIERKFGVVVYNISCNLFGTNLQIDKKHVVRVWNLKVAKLAEDGIKTLSRDSIRVYITE